MTSTNDTAAQSKGRSMFNPCRDGNHSDCVGQSDAIFRDRTMAYCGCKCHDSVNDTDSNDATFDSEAPTCEHGCQYGQHEPDCPNHWVHQGAEAAGNVAAQSKGGAMALVPLDWYFLRFEHPSRRGEAETLVAVLVRPYRPPFDNLIRIDFGYDTKENRIVAQAVLTALNATLPATLEWGNAHNG